MVTIEVGGRPLTLLPQKAGLLPGSDTLLIADAHIGKAVSFRRLGVSLGGRAHDRLRLPCFHIGERVGVLPAFGSFTGMHPIDLVPGGRAVVVAEGSVTELPT